MEVYNERTTVVIGLAFSDEEGVAVTPSSGTWRVDDLTSGTELVATTAFVPAAATHDLVLSEEVNRILDVTRATETRLVTIVAVYSGTRQVTSEYRYQVKNLKKIE